MITIRDNILKSPINNDPNYYGKVDPFALAEAYLRKIWRDVHERKFSHLAAITGRHRTGKSLAAVAMAHLLDPTFLPNLEKRVVYYPDNFMDAVDEVSNENIVGAAIVWDETNLGLPSREWYDVSNKSINYVIQAFGYLRPIVFFVTQDPGFIDSQPRKLWHAFYECKRTNNQYSTLLPFEIKYNKRTGKTYYTYPRFLNNIYGVQGCLLVMKRMHLLLPPKDIIKRYEIHSRNFKRKFITQMKDRTKSLLEKEGSPDKRHHLSEQEILADLMNKKDDSVFVSSRGKFRPDVIADEYKIPVRYARALKHRADAKLRELLEEGTIDE